MRVIGITPINNDLKEEKSMKFLQKLGKALMLPVAVLPICGILMGIGYMLCPEAMQGGDIQGAADMIGLFLVKAGGALIDNMAILFVIGVGVGMSDKNDGTGGIAALDIISRYEASVGVTSICPATMTIAKEELVEVMKNAGEYSYNGGAHLVGINMEGPFISPQNEAATKLYVLISTSQEHLLPALCPLQLRML